MGTSVSRCSRLGRSLFVLVLVTVGVVVTVLAPSSPGHASSDKVLILDSTVTDGAASIEAMKSASLGFTVDIVTPSDWAALTADDFASYRAIILGDPECVEDDSPIEAAVANSSVWGPVVNGNVAIVGTDPAMHFLSGLNPAAAKLLSDNAVAYATAVSGATGAYISLSCYYASARLSTAVPLLDAFSQGGFTTRKANTNTANITDPSSPVVAGLTDAALSDWSNSIHEVFETWPSNFDVVAVDTTSGLPYILTRGPTLPTSANQCKNRGWRTFGMFKNEGDCVSFVATAGRNPPSARNG